MIRKDIRQTAYAATIKLKRFLGGITHAVLAKLELHRVTSIVIVAFSLYHHYQFTSSGKLGA
jgi:hypothetical protein